MTDNNMKPTDILKEEHREVLKKLTALEGVFNRLGKREGISAELKSLAAFFATDFWVHFSKEEEALFPEIEKFIPREGGPLAVMLMEHEELRNTNKEFQQAAGEYLGGSDSTEVKGIIREQGSHFVRVLRDHINKEDNILFMMADMHLDPSQRDRVVRLFHEIERKQETIV